MADSRFFNTSGPFTLAQLCEWTGAALPEKANAHLKLTDVAPLDKASASDVSFFDNVKYLKQYETSKAGACFVRPKYADHASNGLIPLISDDPYRCYAIAAQRFYPNSIDNPSISDRAVIHETASIGAHCRIDGGAVIADHVTIGEHSHIGANAVLESGVEVGGHSYIGPNTVLSHCLIGDHVIIHRNVSIGQDGFGFAMGREGHAKVPQLGRVIIEAHVEIGAGTCIDRGAGPDTTIGAGTKIDNLVQVGHNAKIGKGCIIVSQVGISGSATIGNGVVIAGQAGVAGHITIGDGAMLAARSGVIKDLEGGKNYGGIPAIPIKDWQRQVVALNDIVKKKKRGVPSD